MTDTRDPCVEDDDLQSGARRDAKRLLFRINADASHPYWTFGKQGHEAAVAMVRRLCRDLYGGLRR